MVYFGPHLEWPTTFLLSPCLQNEVDSVGVLIFNRSIYIRKDSEKFQTLAVCLVLGLI